jgi:Tat protein secretion system quality control protein TatD with DNase activity
MYADDIKSIDHPTLIPVPKNKQMSHYFENYSYSAVIYDKYRNVYYRMVERPWKEYHQDMDWMPWLKQLSIVILDEDLNFIGETLLDMEYRITASQFMVTAEGLLLHNRTDDEDELIFDLFTLTKL